MPTFGPDLTDVQIATILTYVRSAWGNQASAVTPAMVAMVRTSAAPDKPHVPEMAH
jgi:mono/diheme cytochrome c family protein